QLTNGCIFEMNISVFSRKTQTSQVQVKTWNLNLNVTCLSFSTKYAVIFISKIQPLVSWKQYLQTGTFTNSCAFFLYDSQVFSCHLKITCSEHYILIEHTRTR